MPLQAQRRNAELIAMLGADFQKLIDPPRAYRVSANVSNPPTDAELDAALTTPANLPDLAVFVVDDSDSANMWLVINDQTNTQWLYAQLSIAV
jgi:hypothetical protein